ncbi:cytochrome c oxidase copper chaperone [Crotalus adamanteus]|uniref:Cytochrome c oxidase copper chaperone n=1 Tax=Crotalus adamanteus TaxID=8729 RepID=A0AAW1C0A2_CROAD
MRKAEGMSNLASCDPAGLQAPTQAEQKPPPSLKPCCACPETKQARDACIIEKGEENYMNKMSHILESFIGDLLWIIGNFTSTTG